MLRFVTACCLAAACSVLPGPCGAQPRPKPLVSGTHITTTTAVRAGTYRLGDSGSGAVQLTGSDYVVDFHGAKLVGPRKNKGVGIHITDARNITIRNADVTGFQWGIVIERSVGIVLEKCGSSRNGNLPPGTVIDESGKEPEDQWGGGILIRDSRDCTVAACKAEHQWDGIDVVRSENNRIVNNTFSYNGNWGLHLWNSSRNTFANNAAIWCTTGAGELYQALTGWQTYDSQAVGIDHNSNENVIIGNDLRFGGDGIFIRANEGPITPGTVVPPRNGSHRNLLRGNDCSFSPNNAIEVDLVDDTVIENNNCSYSNYGMWLGYSRRCLVRSNIAIDDSVHAVEIENGQSDVFESNIFGFGAPLPGRQLVLLRQNGRDKTPSSGYRFMKNRFFGASTGVRLVNTSAAFQGNSLIWHGAGVPATAAPDSRSTAREVGDSVNPSRVHPLPALASLKALVIGRWNEAAGRGLEAVAWPLAATVDGIPVSVKRLEDGSVRLLMPPDMWDRPAPDHADVRLLDGLSESAPVTVPIKWPASMVLISGVTPNPAKIGDTIKVRGVGLQGGRVLLNGKPVEIAKRTRESIEFQVPEDILTSSRYNLLFERGDGENRQTTWPIAFAVNVPSEQMPHIVSATFSPTTLRVGELLTITFVVRNNLPIPAHLTTRPKDGFMYDEKQAYWEMGIEEMSGTLHLRVTSDKPAGHDSGSWPWLFGFDKDVLAPGEAATVTGTIRMETPGEREFRVGLVATGSRFIDDNVFRTRITVK